MRKRLSVLVIAVLALAVFAVYLSKVGAWPAVTSFTSSIFGSEVGSGVDNLGKGTTEVTNTISEIDPTDVGEALAALATLPTTGSTRIPDYERDEFGKAWSDVDRNGCDTRNDILARDLTRIEVAKDGCIVLSGRLHDPYTGDTIRFTRGQSTSSKVQIDHIVPLSLAWSSGAWDWSDAKRLAFANDPNNLLAVDGPTNSSKSDSGPSEWMPPAKGYACAYAGKFTAVIVAYDLTVSAADKATLKRTLAACR